jgi:hypothetical protein
MKNTDDRNEPMRMTMMREPEQVHGRAGIVRSDSPTPRVEAGMWDGRERRRFPRRMLGE